MQVRKRLHPSELVRESRRQRIDANNGGADAGPTLIALPSDIINLVLQLLDTPSSLMFAITCKRFLKMWRNGLPKEPKVSTDHTQLSAVPTAHRKNLWERLVNECLLTRNAYEKILLRFVEHCDDCKLRMIRTLNTSIALWTSIGVLGMRQFFNKLYCVTTLQTRPEGIKYALYGALSSGHVEMIPNHGSVASKRCMEVSCANRASTLYMLQHGHDPVRLLRNMQWPIGKGVLSLLVSRVVVGSRVRLLSSDLPNELWSYEHCYPTLAIILGSNIHWEEGSLVESVLSSRCPKALEYLLSTKPINRIPRATSLLKEVRFTDHTHVADVFRHYNGNLADLLEKSICCGSKMIIAGLGLACLRKDPNFIFPMHKLASHRSPYHGSVASRNAEEECGVDEFRRMLTDVNRMLEKEVFTTTNLYYLILGYSSPDDTSSSC